MSVLGICLGCVFVLLRCYVCFFLRLRALEVGVNNVLCVSRCYLLLHVHYFISATATNDELVPNKQGPFNL